MTKVYVITVNVNAALGAADTDTALFRFYLDGDLKGERPKGADGKASFTYAPLPTTEAAYVVRLGLAAVDAAGNASAVVERDESVPSVDLIPPGMPQYDSVVGVFMSS
jgi:hypothetical protein